MSQAPARHLSSPGTDGPRLCGAGLTDVGRQRAVNEDRLHLDLARGIFMVVDGVGGHAAGGRAADIAVRLLRERLERQTGDTADRVREAITIANNEIFHEAQRRPEWRGMACVLTIAIVEHGRVVIGHVGDTRLYLLQRGLASKLTPDHSPVGEREDARELTELEAMRHPRRNEVFRDVGSALVSADDREFAYVAAVDFPVDAALLLCSDGLTDLVPLDAIRSAVHEHRGRPADVVDALVRAANHAGGKDNITTLYVENERFAVGVPTRNVVAASGEPGGWGGWMASGFVVLALVVAAGLWAWREGWPGSDLITTAVAPSSATSVSVVRPGESITAAVAQAAPGSTVIVEPGEYRERLTLRDHVRLTSRLPRQATLRLPADAAPDDALIVAAGVRGAELSGFRLTGDAHAPLGVGVATRGVSIRLIDLDISGATTAAAVFGEGDDVQLLGSEIHDNPGAGLIVGADASVRMAHNTFARNGTVPGTAPFVFEPGAHLDITGNVFRGTTIQALGPIDDEIRRGVMSSNVFVPTPSTSDAARTPASGSR